VRTTAERMLAAKIKGGSMKKIKISQVYVMNIKPALKPEERHKIEDALKKLKYKLLGGGQCVDGSECDISFCKK